MNGELLRLVDAIHRDKNIDRDILLEGIEQALASAARKVYGSEEITVTIDREVRELDLDLAGWGQERVTGTRVERVGSDTQRFTIEVGK